MHETRSTHIARTNGLIEQSQVEWNLSSKSLACRQCSRAILFLPISWEMNPPTPSFLDCYFSTVRAIVPDKPAINRTRVRPKAPEKFKISNKTSSLTLIYSRLQTGKGYGHLSFITFAAMPRVMVPLRCIGGFA